MSNMFERDPWAGRLAILVAVVAGVVLALGAFWVALVDVYHCFAMLVDYADPSLEPRAYSNLRSDAVTTIVKALAAPCPCHPASAAAGRRRPG